MIDNLVPNETTGTSNNNTPSKGNSRDRKEKTALDSVPHGSLPTPDNFKPDLAAKGLGILLSRQHIQHSSQSSPGLLSNTRAHNQTTSEVNWTNALLTNPDSVATKHNARLSRSLSSSEHHSKRIRGASCAPGLSSPTQSSGERGVGDRHAEQAIAVVENCQDQASERDTESALAVNNATLSQGQITLSPGELTLFVEDNPIGAALEREIENPDRLLQQNQSNGNMSNHDSNSDKPRRNTASCVIPDLGRPVDTQNPSDMLPRPAWNQPQNPSGDMDAQIQIDGSRASRPLRCSAENEGLRLPALAAEMGQYREDGGRNDRVDRRPSGRKEQGRRRTSHQGSSHENRGAPGPFDFSFQHSGYGNTYTSASSNGGNQLIAGDRGFGRARDRRTDERNRREASLERGPSGYFKPAARDGSERPRVREDRRANMDRLNRVLSVVPRGRAILAYIREREDRARDTLTRADGDTFFAAMLKLFKKNFSVKHGVHRLNDTILIRLQTPNLNNSLGVKRLMVRDINETIETVENAAPFANYRPIVPTVALLRRLGLTHHACGILDEGDGQVAALQMFEDEDEDVDPPIKLDQEDENDLASVPDIGQDQQLARRNGASGLVQEGRAPQELSLEARLRAAEWGLQQAMARTQALENDLQEERRKRRRAQQYPAHVRVVVAEVGKLHTRMHQEGVGRLTEGLLRAAEEVRPHDEMVAQNMLVEAQQKLEDDARKIGEKLRGKKREADEIEEDEGEGEGGEEGH